MDSRRDTLRIIGAIGTTCAFPFGADELYGQHVHVAPQTAATPYKLRFFTEAETAVVARVADLIIPPTGTPGAVAAGVPVYIDLVVSANAEHQKTFRAGIADLASKNFLALPEERQIALLTELSEAKDGRFFQAVKGMTADGYYTSRIGLVSELGYQGSPALTAFPVCGHPEHHG